MTGALERVLELVAQGRLTAEEAGPLLDALEVERAGAASTSEPAGNVDRGPATSVRVEITDKGRSVVNLRVPLSLGRAALERLPGLSPFASERLAEAIRSGIKGSIVEVDDDGDRVRVVIE